MLSWHVLLKFKRTIDQRSTLVFALTGIGSERSSGCYNNILLVQQFQKAMTDVPAHNSLGLFWVFGHSGIRGNEIADELAKGGERSAVCWTETCLGGL
jgi:hypothetical protein